MATFHDSALGSAAASSVGPLATADALAVTVGDLIVATGKWESGTTTVTFDSGASTPLFTVANAVRQEGGSLTCGAVYFWIATATGTINPRFTLGAARDFREIRAFSITPAAGKTFVLGNVNAADGISSLTAISAGTASATGAGVGVTGIALFGSRTITPGTSWTEPAELNTSISAHAQYQPISGSGTITGDCTLSSAVEWVAQLALFTEVSTGGSRPLLSQITLNPGGIPIGPSVLAPGKAPNYGAVRWQEWEKYPWEPTSSAVITQIFAADVVGAIEAALLAGDGTLTAAELVASIESANLRADGKLSAADFVSAIAGANLTATGALTAGDLVSAIEAGALGGLGSLSAQDVVAAIDAATVGGVGALSAGDVVGAVEAAFLDIFVVLTQITAADVVGAVEGANLQGLGALTGVDVVGALETAALIASGALSADDVVAAIESANLQALASGTRKLRVIGSVIVRRLH